MSIMFTIADLEVVKLFVMDTELLLSFFLSHVYYTHPVCVCVWSL